MTFGSYILEQVLSIMQQEAKSTLRFAEVERLELGNPLKKISNYLGQETGKLSIISKRSVLGAWAVFQYNVAYVADEKSEIAEQVWVN